jgi:hypothetical protein
VTHDPRDPDAPPPDRHPDQLTATGAYPPYNHVIHGPPGTEISSLWIGRGADEGGKVVTISAWELDDRQKAMIEAGAHIQLAMWEFPICPVAMSVEGPFCECHGEEMLFSQEEGGFYCAHQEVVSGADDGEASRRSAEEQVRGDFSPAADDSDDDDPDDLPTDSVVD